MEGRSLRLVFFLCLLCLCIFPTGSDHAHYSPRKVISVTFLVSVNDTWSGCLETAKTPPIKPDQQWNESKIIHVGKCDQGPLTFQVKEELSTGVKGQQENHTYIYLTFWSQIPASPPTCRILWDSAYLKPTTDSSRESLLPGCWTSDSDEGAHVTYYWFHVLDWQL